MVGLSDCEGNFIAGIKEISEVVSIFVKADGRGPKEDF